MSSNNIVCLAENEEYSFYRVPSESDPNLTYGVDIDKVEGTCYCDCPHFRYRLQTENWGGARLEDNEHHCKHISEVLNHGKERS